MIPKMQQNSYSATFFLKSKLYLCIMRIFTVNDKCMYYYNIFDSIFALKCKVHFEPEFENETIRNETKQNKTKQNKTKQNKTKQNKTKQNKTKQNKTIRNETKRNETKRNETKRFFIVNNFLKNGDKKVVKLTVYPNKRFYFTFIYFPI
jgi:hypothetical protein